MSVPSPDVASSAWYCAEGTSTPDGRADETVIVASVAPSTVDATITVMPGGDGAPKSRHLRLAPGEETRVKVADILATPEPGVVVETTGGPAAVSHQLQHDGDFAVEPCTRAAGPDWYFAVRHDGAGGRARPRVVQPLRRRRHRRRHLPHRHRGAAARRPAGRGRAPPLAHHDPGAERSPAPGTRRRPGPRPGRPGRRRAEPDLRRHRARPGPDPRGHRGVARRAVTRRHLVVRRRHHRQRRHRLALAGQLRRPRRARAGARRAGLGPEAGPPVAHRAGARRDRDGTDHSRARSGPTTRSP